MTPPIDPATLRRPDGTDGPDPRTLHDVRDRVARFRRLSDGMLFGYVGLDAATGLLPGVGALYSAGGGLWLLRQAARARCSRRTMGYGTGLVAADVVVGAVPVLGDLMDVFLRSHAWFANRILEDIDTRLAAADDRPPAPAATVRRRDRRQAAGAAAAVVLVLLSAWLIA